MKYSILLCLSMAMFLISCGTGTNDPESLACDNAIEATMRNYSDLDGCQWVFESEAVDRLIEPINLADFISDPEESKELKITYVERPDMATICMAGLTYRFSFFKIFMRFRK